MPNTIGSTVRLAASACCRYTYKRPGDTLCAVCAATRCTGCNYLRGHHAPSCRASRCRGCGNRTAQGSKHYCDACRLNQCPECRVLGGRHGPRCLYIRRRRRPGLTEYRGVVTEDDIATLYITVRRRAVATARRICGDLSAEDVVSDAVVYLLERRDYLRDVPGQAYFMRAVKHAALRQLRSAWHRYTAAMDPADLVVVEQMALQRHGRRSERDIVRLPAATPACPGCGGDVTPGNIAPRYCGLCSARTCRECRRYGGVHSPDCSRRSEA